MPTEIASAQIPPLSRLERLLAMLRLRCPRCCRGPVFRGWFTMNYFCLECGYRFVREAGFFLGAMYISYLIGAVLLAAFTALLKLCFLTEWPLWMVLGPAFLLLLPFAPVIFWYSRVGWFHFEQWVNPL